MIQFLDMHWLEIDGKGVHPRLLLMKPQLIEFHQDDIISGV